MAKIRRYPAMKKTFSYPSPSNPKPLSGKRSGNAVPEAGQKPSSCESRKEPYIPPPNFTPLDVKKENALLDEKTLGKNENGVAEKFIQEIDYDDEDDGETFAKSLNGIILQYLEACGLTESYTTFYDECKSSGMLIPSHFKAELEGGISLQDVETLIIHFDQENGDALLELWEVLTGMLDEGQHSHEVGKITFYIQVYIALIPFRQKMSEEKKSASLSKLRAYFETQSEKCTMDKEMLALFALPFVPDPESHPVFCNLFQVTWVKKLRSRIKNLARTLCCPNKLITREDTDLAKMFKICTNAVPHDIESTDGKKICVFSNVQPMQFTSGVTVFPNTPKKSSDEEFCPSLLFQRMNDLILENERYKSEESKYEKQCAQLLNVSLLLAQSLEEAAQGKEVNMEKLRHEVNQCLPVPMVRDEASMNTIYRQHPPSSGNTSDESEPFNQAPLFDMHLGESEPPEKSKSAPKPSSDNAR